MLLLHGLPGLGKSHTADRWAVETGAVFLRAKVDWSPRYFLRDHGGIRCGCHRSPA